MSQPSTTLLALLRHAKASSDYSIGGLITALEPVFFPDLSLLDVMSITHSAFEEALAEPRYEIGNPSYRMRELLLAPIKGSDAVNWPYGTHLGTTATIDQFYSAILSCLMGHLRLSRVDWLIASGVSLGVERPHAG